eukprot:3940579-Rhodomonas_salina.2
MLSSYAMPRLHLSTTETEYVVWESLGCMGTAIGYGSIPSGTSGVATGGGGGGGGGGGRDAPAGHYALSPYAVPTEVVDVRSSTTECAVLRWGVKYFDILCGTDEVWQEHEVVLR